MAQAEATAEKLFTVGELLSDAVDVAFEALMEESYLVWNGVVAIDEDGIVERMPVYSGDISMEMLSYMIDAGEATGAPQWYCLCTVRDAGVELLYLLAKSGQDRSGIILNPVRDHRGRISNFNRVSTVVDGRGKSYCTPKVRLEDFYGLDISLSIKVVPDWCQGVIQGGKL